MVERRMGWLERTSKRILQDCGVRHHAYVFSLFGVLCVLCVLGGTHASAQVAYHEFSAGSGMKSTHIVQPTKRDAVVSLSVRDSTVASVVRMIAHQAHLKIVYDNTNPTFAKHVTVRVVKMSVMDAFERALHGTGLAATLASDGETVVIRPASQVKKTDQAEEGGKIQGQVIDSATGQGLGGATVVIQGTKLSVTTSAQGTFVLDHVPAGEHVVHVRMLGYASQSRTITIENGKMVRVDMILYPNATILSGMVTTATGVQRKLSVGNDITTINVDSVMAHAPVSSVTDLLETRVPGLTVLHTSGTPGDPSRLRLRGAASITGSNAPIVVVDGIRVYSPDGSSNQAVGKADVGTNVDQLSDPYPRPSPLDQIDPNTIATIDVMKGPSASALYGSDAANGVIVITTKKGQPGKTRWSLALEQGTSAIQGGYPENYYRFGRYPGGANTQCPVYDIACDLDSVVAYQALNDASVTPLTRGWNSSASATVSGGMSASGSALTYSFTGSANQQDGMLRLPGFVRSRYQDTQGEDPPSWMVHPDGYQRYSGGGQLTAQIGVGTSVTASHSLTYSRQRRSSLGVGGVAPLLTTYKGDDLSLLLKSFSERVKSVTRSDQSGISINWLLRSWLPLRIDGGLNTVGSHDSRFVPAGLPRDFAYRQGPGSDLQSGQFGLATGSSTVTTINSGTTIPLSLSHGIRFHLALGTNFHYQTNELNSIYTWGFPTGVEDPNTFVPANTSVNRSSIASSTFGWFIEPQLQLPGRFFVNPGIRFDGGSASGKRAGLLHLPKINASWVAIDDAGGGGGELSWRHLLTQLRLRGAVGVAGVQPDPGAQLRLFTPASISVDAGATTDNAVILTTLGNTRLRPEESSEFEGGFDAVLLDQRLTLTATQYYKKRRHAIITVPTAPSVSISGVGGQSLNIGAVLNTGTELTASARILDSRQVQWSVDMSASHNANRVLSLGPDQETMIFANGAGIVPGYPLFGVWAAPIAGFFDRNGDGRIEPDEISTRAVGDAVFVGSTDPMYETVINTNLGLFNSAVTITTSVQYQHGLTQYYGSGGISALQSAANAPDAPLLTQAIALASTPGIYSSSSRYALTDYYLYQRVNILRWDALSVNYRLPASFVRMLKGHTATVALQGRNLGLHTNYRGKDPNVNAISSGNGVRDLGALPQPRTWTLRFSVFN